MSVDAGPITHGGFGTNSDTFDSLPEDVQQVIAELELAYSVENARLSEGRETTNFENMAEKGATAAIMPDDQKIEWVNRMSDIGKKWIEETEARGNAGGEMLKTFMEVAEGARSLRDWSANIKMNDAGSFAYAIRPPNSDRADQTEGTEIPS